MKRRYLAALAVLIVVATVWGLQSAAFEAFLAREAPVWAWRFGFRVALRSLHVDLFGPALRVEGLRVAPAAGEWVASAERLSVRLHPLTSLSGTPHFSLEVRAPRFRGEIRPSGKKKFELPDVVFDTVRIEGGSVSASFPSAGVVLEVPDIRVQWLGGQGGGVARGGGLTWAGAREPITQASFEGSRRFGMLNLDRFALSTGRVRLDGSGRMGLKHLLDARVEARLSLRNLPDPWIDGLGLGRYRPVAADLRVRGRLGGRLEAPTFAGGASLSSGRFGPLAFGGGSAVLSADAGGLSFRGVEVRTSAGGARGVEGRLSWSEGLRVDARGQALDYDLRSFMALFVKGHFPVGLRATGTFAAKGSLYPKLGLRCRVDATGRDFDVTTLSEEGSQTWFSLPAGRISARCTVGEADLDIAEALVDGGSARLEVRSGRVQYAHGLDFQTDLRVSDLSLIRRYLPEGTDARGRAVGHFGGPYNQLSFHYDLSLDSVSLWGQPLGALSGRADYDLTDLTLKGAVLQGDLGRFEASGRARLRPGGDLDLSVGLQNGALSPAAALLRRVVEEMPTDVEGSVSASGHVAGTLDDPRFEGSAALAAVKVRGYSLDEATLDGDFGRGRWLLRGLSATAYGARLQAAGSGDREYFEISGALAGVTVAGIGSALGKQLPAKGGFDGAVRAWGSYRSPSAELSGRWSDLEVSGQRIGGADLRGSLQGSEAMVHLAAHSGAALASLVLSTSGEGLFSAEVEARGLAWSALPVASLPGELGAGSLTGHGRVEGSLRPGGRVSKGFWEGVVADVRYGALRVGPVKTRCDYGSAGLQFSIEGWEGEARIAGFTALGEGAPLAVSITLNGLDLARFSELASIPRGTVSARGGASLDLAMLKEAPGTRKLEAVRGLEFAGRAEGVIVPGWLLVPSFDFRLGGDAGRPELRATGPGLRLEAALTDPQSLAWHASLTLEGFAPASLFPRGHALDGLQGTVATSLEARGRGAKVDEASIEGGGRGLAWGRLAPLDATWNGSLAGSAASFEVRGPRGLTARGTWNTEAGLKVAGTLDNVPLQGWLAEGSLPSDFQGAVSGGGELRWQREAGLKGFVLLRKLEASLPPVKIANAGDLLVSYGGNELHFDSVHLKGEGFDVQVTGGLTPGERWGIKVRGRADLALVSRGVPRVRKSEGVATAEVSIEGPWRSPVLEGPVEILPGARFAVDGFDLPVEDLDARAYLDGTRGLVVEWVDAQVGEGRVHLEGFLGMDGLRPKDLKFLAEVRDVSYEFPKQVTYRVDADALVTGTAVQPEVRGEVRLKEFLYAKRVNWKSMAFDALKRRPREVGGAAGERTLFVDLSFLGDKGLRVENNIGSLDLGVDLRARGYLPRPALIGRVEARGGEVRFRSQQYDVLKSTVEFLGETQPIPLLDIHARTAAAQYAVTVDVTGPLDGYQVSLASVPPLTQTDLVALLTLGATSDQTRSADQISAATAASFLTGRIQDLLESEAGETLGLDQFAIDTAYSTATQTSMPRVTVGKSITQALSARYSMAVGDETLQDLELQYNVSPKLQLLGSWADKGSNSKLSLGGEVRLRFTFR